MQFKLFNLLAFAPVALGKDMIPYIRIDMGKDDVPRFTPPSVTANVGDLLVFYWHGNHTIATSPFEKPCQYNKENYFFSGPYSNSKNGRLAFEVNVTTTYPIYFYCTVDENCHKAMVGGINLPTSGKRTLDAYARKAKDAPITEPPHLYGGKLIDPKDLDHDEEEFFAQDVSNAEQQEPPVDTSIVIETVTQIVPPNVEYLTSTSSEVERIIVTEPIYVATETVIISSTTTAPSPTIIVSDVTETVRPTSTLTIIIPSTSTVVSLTTVPSPTITVSDVTETVSYTATSRTISTTTVATVTLRPTTAIRSSLISWTETYFLKPTTTTRVSTTSWTETSLVTVTTTAAGATVGLGSHGVVAGVLGLAAWML